MSLLIKNGRVVLASDDYPADIYVADETISLVGERLDVDADRVIDATGKYVLPGGVDPHTHLESPIEMKTVDDFTVGTIAAAVGGTTTVVDFCGQQRGQSLTDALAGWHERLAENQPVVDVGFHMIVTDLDRSGSLDELAGMTDAGVTSYKVFMAYKGLVMLDDDAILAVMEVARETGALVMVHAENGRVIDLLVRRALEAGRTAPHWHARTRPPVTEGEATARAIQLARLAAAPLYVVHVSCREALEPLARARAEGAAVWGETCPQYLFLDETFLERPGLEGARYVFTPPARTQDDQEELWEALVRKPLSVVSSDHSAWSLAQKETGAYADFAQIPNGAPGVEHRLVLLHHHGVRSGRLSLNRFVELVSTNPAKLFGLYPAKGTIAVGSDADLVVWDPEKRLRISASTQCSRAGFCLYEGHEVIGGPELVTVRGRIVVERDELVAEPGVGRFVRRARFGEPLDRRQGHLQVKPPSTGSAMPVT